MEVSAWNLEGGKAYVAFCESWGVLATVVFAPFLEPSDLVVFILGKSQNFYSHIY